VLWPRASGVHTHGKRHVKRAAGRCPHDPDENGHASTRQVRRDCVPSCTGRIRGRRAWYCTTGSPPRCAWARARDKMNGMDPQPFKGSLPVKVAPGRKDRYHRPIGSWSAHIRLGDANTRVNERNNRKNGLPVADVRETPLPKIARVTTKKLKNVCTLQNHEQPVQNVHTTPRRLRVVGSKERVPVNRTVSMPVHCTWTRFPVTSVCTERSGTQPSAWGGVAQRRSQTRV